MGTVDWSDGSQPNAIWLRITDFIVIILGLGLVNLTPLPQGLAPNALAVWAIVAGLLMLYCSEVFSLYRSWRLIPFADVAVATILTWGLVSVGLLFCLYFLKLDANFGRTAFVAWVSLVAVMLVAWRWLYRRYLQAQSASGQHLKKALVIGATPMASLLVNEIKSKPGLGIQVLGICDDREPDRVHADLQDQLIGNIEYALTRAAQGGVDKLFVALPMKAEARIAQILERCTDSISEIHLVPNFFIYNLFNAAWHNVGKLKTLSVYESPIRGPWGALKRAEDLTIATVALLVFAIPMLLIALAIRLESKGPAIFKQSRYGIDGKKIEVWKFRSMTTSDNGTTIKQATRDDCRITRLGKVLRRTSLDELPQFINVLQGSMSVVGPRPHAVAHNEQYRALIQGYMLRHKVKPGITGWAQVNGWRGETDTLDKMAKRVEFDLHYITHWSVLFDIQIVAMTLTKGFSHENAY
ncbi:undecaprenyl-phosphate glucose phosphotransferase [Ferrimonas marina]|uniref:Putative colanic acid biosysnthesis UDP-glucose lipid carrier transferase n=1 Tax=Ferrimonas marina TaxID=299255 RepID=A0A1M5ZR35_9GAMM|nr:undecaprenyl-phosphate glucose phosphotransferase [Ferrimonas marina]SHI26556.1 putative colanic acid biosysnthesis UDP-glucose lipid carrier transferase [Ferrimonas marina]